MGCPREPHSPLSGSYWPASNPESPRSEFGKSNSLFFPRKRKLKPKPKAWLPSACTGSIQVSPNQRSWSFPLVSTAIMLIRGQA